MCMDLASQSTAYGVGIVQAKCSAAISQQWASEDMGDGWLRLKSRHSGLCLDVNGAKKADSTPVIQYACSTAANQQWTRQ